MPGEICTSCSIGTGTKGAWYGAREEAYSGTDLLGTRTARHNRFVRGAEVVFAGPVARPGAVELKATW